MLDAITKRKIDSARDILVGKVPDPKAQVEQITTALIYKFMDDMDKEAQELGGKARFFTNGYEKYAWTKLMDTKLGGRERLDLYLEGVSNLGRNQHMPQLFRDIFGEKSLPPYRDAQTLTLFLKEINGFNFDHSEDLGDAYEYLLNVIGTSGEAGQFRTPRHIIDFIVAVVAPKKDETICDPACGTAGFLISAFKHIIADHDCKDNITGKPTNKEILLTPDERKKLMNNFVGYDIDPGMVRIAAVNMYLHSFPKPKIFEYDTLTYEDRWDESFDIMLANPPFMTPKGGIRPHKRFSVQANRSEVLFVDYILEHLQLNGRAGIIVPEGIIFRNDTAYKKLRKKLIEDGLYAVVSLPQGIFAKPGGKGNVKTSILFFDNQLAKKSDEILFVKVENDGFDLGAQKRKIEKNDLPEVIEILEAWKQSKKKKSDLAFLVKKEKISESGDYNLAGERYKKVKIRKNQKWPMVELGEVCKIEKGTSITKAKVSKGKIPVIAGGQQPAYYHSKSNREGKTITVSASGAYAGFVNYFDYPIFASDCTTIKAKNENKFLTDFVFHLLKSKQAEIYKFQKGAGQPHVYGKELAKIRIPLPPIEVQKEIVEQVEVKQNAISAAEAVIENLEKERRYFGQSLRKIKNVEWVELGEVCTFEYGKPLKEINRKSGEYPVYGSNGIVGYHDECLVKGPFIIVGRKGTAGAVVYSEKSGFPIDTTFYIQLKDQKVDLKFLYLIMTTLDLGKVNIQAGVPGLNRNDAYKIKILLPSLEIQKQMIVEVEKEEEIIATNRRLIELMEGKIINILSDI